MSNYIPGIGPKSPLFAIVGEAPGREEDLNGEPFWPEAPSGSLLMNSLRSQGIARSEVYLTNVVKYRPTGNDFSRYFNYGEFTDEGEEAVDELID